MRNIRVDDCPNCGDSSVNYYAGAWRIENNEGYTGDEIKFCPYCGYKLKPVEVKEIEK